MFKQRRSSTNFLDVTRVSIDTSEISILGNHGNNLNNIERNNNSNIAVNNSSNNSTTGDNSEQAIPPFVEELNMATAMDSTEFKFSYIRASYWDIEYPKC